MEKVAYCKGSVDELKEEKPPSGNSDNDFKANDESLGKGQSKGKGLGWKDMSKEGQYFVDDVAPSDIKQGSLGTCYFLAAIAAICERKPGLLKQRLMTNGKDWYGIRWYANGKPRDTWVDDKFPTKDGKFRYAHSQKNELWVAVLEKCYAKEFGSYSDIENGFPGDSMHDITGKPSVVHNLQSHWDGENWAVVGACQDKSKIVCASITGSPFLRMVLLHSRYINLIFTSIYNCIDSLFECCGLSFILDFFEFIFYWTYSGITCLLGLIDQACCGIFSSIHVFICLFFTGLCPGHAYSVLEVKAVPCAGCLESKMIKLRNPWGQGEWNGCYSDKSWAWALRPELKKVCNVSDKNDGSFWMSMSDFQKYFDTVDICHYDDGNFETRVEAQLTKKDASISFTVPTRCKIRVSFTQPRKDLKKRYSCKLGIKKNDHFVTRTGYSAGSCNHSTDEVEVDAGTYKVTIEGHRNKNLGFTCRVMISSSAAGVKFEDIEAATGKPENVNSKLLVSKEEERSATPVNKSESANKVAPAPTTPLVAASVTTTTTTTTTTTGGDDGDGDDNDDDDDDNDDDTEKGKSGGDGKEKKKKGSKKKGGKKKK